MTPEIEPLDGVDGDGLRRTIATARRRRAFLWLSLLDPDDETIRAVQAVLGIHPAAAADVVSGRQQPKIQNPSAAPPVIESQTVSIRPLPSIPPLPDRSGCPA